jgi:hypothetical protein
VNPASLHLAAFLIAQHLEPQLQLFAEP